MWSEVMASIMLLVLGISAMPVRIVGMIILNEYGETVLEWQCPEGGNIASLSISRHVW
jgi:hypothetical protein